MLSESRTRAAITAGPATIKMAIFLNDWLKECWFVNIFG